MKKLLLLTLFPLTTLAIGTVDISSITAREYPPEMKKEIQEYNNQLKTKGYVEQDLPTNAKKLLEIIDHKDDVEYLAKEEFVKNYKEIKTMFPFNPIEKGEIGYGGALGKNTAGWAGIVEVFYPSKEIGICFYDVYYLGMSFGENPTSHLNPENMTHQVSGKPTKAEITGSVKTGYSYMVRWYDPSYIRQIECFNTDLDFSIKNKVVEIAKEADKL